MSRGPDLKEICQNAEVFARLSAPTAEDLHVVVYKMAKERKGRGTPHCGRLKLRLTRVLS